MVPVAEKTASSAALLGKCLINSAILRNSYLLTIHVQSPCLVVLLWNMVDVLLWNMVDGLGLILVLWLG